MLICITGLTGSGKTTALNRIAQKGYTTFEVDKFIHSIYNKGDKGYEVIRDTFGPEYINEQGVDRKKLGQLVFNDKDQLNKLNNLMLPFIKQKLRELKKQNKLIFVEMAIFLNYVDYFENSFDDVIIIQGKEEIQNKKLNDLKWYKDSKTLINPINNESHGNYIIVENLQSVSDLEHKVDKLLEQYKR